MSDETKPVAKAEADTRNEGPFRREELHAKVREANKQSVTGPDSPAFHVYGK